MFLKRMKLTNVRSIRELEIFFEVDDPATGGSRRRPEAPTRRKWTLILGENGSGKSSILRAISLIVAGSDALPELLSKPDSWIRLGEKSCRLEADLVTADGQERQIQLGWERGEGIRQIFERNHEAMQAIDAAISHSARNYFTVGYGASRRLPQNSSSPGFAPEVFVKPRARGVGTLFSGEAVLNALDTWAMDLDYRKSGSGLETVKAALADLLPGVSLSRIDRRNRELLFDTQDGELPLGQLSDGYQNMAAWCGDLLYRITETYEDYKNPLSARGLLLIDEVDLHLHPVWQRRLRQFLDAKLPNFQIVATTHSPLTAQQAGEDELYFLRRPDPHGPAVLEHYEGAPNTLLIHQVLLSPAFGLDTMDSQHVEDLRDEYRLLRDKTGQPSPREKRRLNELADQLADLPDWSTESEHDREQISLLNDIKAALRTNGANGTAS